jgi:AraC family transcriptional regulator, activator of mtrCDE
MCDRSEILDPIDLFSELLDKWRFHGDPGFNGEFTTPWGLSFEKQPGRAPFYVVPSGLARLELTDPPALSWELGAKDLVLLPGGDAHILRDSSGSLATPASSLPPQPHHGGMRTLRWGGGGTPTQVVGGVFRFDSSFALPILGAMDRVIVIRAHDRARFEGIDSVLGLFCHEGRSGLPGNRAAISGLLKLLFIQIMRTTLSARQPENQTCRPSPLVLMMDRSLRTAAEAIHLESEKPWTIEALAALVGMSRTTFALRFQALVGTSPLAYLTQVRMLQATSYLDSTDETLEAIAGRVGYGSEAAFATAFKRELGLAPGAWRRRSGKGRETA